MDYEVFNVDSVAPREELCPFIFARFSRFWADGRCILLDGRLRQGGVECLRRGRPPPGCYPGAATFRRFNNLPQQYAAAHTTCLRRRVGSGLRISFGHQVRRSSDCRLRPPPPYVPVDEECSFPESAYSLSKLLEKKWRGNLPLEIRDENHWPAVLKYHGAA